jgi:hypothetical protein
MTPKALSWRMLPLLGLDDLFLVLLTAFQRLDDWVLVENIVFS